MSTTYYAKPLEYVTQAIYDVNPAAFVGVGSKLGRFPLSINDPWATDWVHYNSILKAAKVRIADTPGWDAVAQSIPQPAARKAKVFYWNDAITETEYKSLEANPTGLIAQNIRARLKGQQDYFLSTVDNWLIGYLYASTYDDYDADWIPLMHQKAASGTVVNPVDINSTAGTAEDYTGSKCSGTAATVDAYATSYGSARQLFFQQYDSNTHQAMYHGGDTFDLWQHPAVTERLNNAHMSDASGYIDFSHTFKEYMQRDYTINDTFAVDAAYDNASPTEAQFVVSMNTKENFQLGEIIPYTVEPYTWNPATRKFEMRAYWKIVPFARPYYINSVWKKACGGFRVKPYSNT